MNKTSKTKTKSILFTAILIVLALVGLTGCQTAAPQFEDPAGLATQPPPLSPGQWLSNNFTQGAAAAVASQQPSASEGRKTSVVDQAEVVKPGSAPATPAANAAAVTAPAALVSNTAAPVSMATPASTSTTVTAPTAAVVPLAHTTPAASNASNLSQTEPILLREGDVVRLTFPGAPGLNGAFQIQRDGKINLPQIGLFKAVGLAPAEMEKQLIELYRPQLQIPEVTVTLETSAFPVYISGAVLRPGKILVDRPMRPLEAIMEAGGFDYSRANMKAVRIIRKNQDRTEYFKLNLKGELQGKAPEPFALKPLDIIFVPERFTWF